jgi:2,4-dienoyl-CoA reductase-like NADH-dependent reductase (Old Yellow Enzyme family)
MRLGLEIAKRVRESIPENIVLGVRVSVTDYVEKGWDVPQTVEFAKELKKLNIDFVDCSSGGLVSTVKYHGLNSNTVQIAAAGTIQKEVGITTAAVGKIINPNFAEKILKENTASLIMIGRAFLNTPHWPYHASDVLGAQKQIKYPNQYNWAIGPISLIDWRKTVLKDENNN